MIMDTQISENSRSISSLNERQRRFCNGVLEGLPATRAYKTAGYASQSERSVEVCSSKLLRNAKVVSFMDKRRKASETETMLTRREVLEERAKIVRDPNTPDSVKLQAMRDEEKARGWSSPEVVEVNGSLIDQIRGIS